MVKKRKEDIRVVKRSWAHRMLLFSGFSLLLFFLFNLSVTGIIANIPFSEEIVLGLLTILTISFIIERSLKKKKNLYEFFYSYYLAAVLISVTIIYWILFINNIESGIFLTLIVLTNIILFLYSLITIEHSEKVWFIGVSYAFTAIITIILFAYLYWSFSVFGVGYLQFDSCKAISEELRSDNWFYFSSVTFYSLGYGDICPASPSTRIVSQLEVAIGALINTIFIGFIFWRIRETRIEEEVKKDIENEEVKRRKNLKRSKR